MENLVICISNEGYPASLEVGEVYVSIPDPDAERHGLIRVIDESGEDYLFPKERFRKALQADFAPRIRAPRGEELEWARAEAERLGLLDNLDKEKPE